MFGSIYIGMGTNYIVQASVYIAYIALAIALFSLYMFYKLYVSMAGNIKRAFAILGTKSGESKRDTIMDEKIDGAIGDIMEGIAMENPTVQLAMSLIENYTDLEITPEVIMAFMRHPMVKKLMDEFGARGKTSKEVESPYGPSRYTFKR